MNSDPSTSSQRDDGTQDPGPTAPSIGLEDALVSRAMAESFVRDSLGGLVGHPAAGIVALILFWGLTDVGFSLLWFSALLLVTGGRSLLGRRAMKLLGNPMEARKLALVGVLLSGLVWGIGGVYFGIELPQAYLGIILVIFSGLVAAATATLMADSPSFYGFSTLLLGSIFLGIVLRPLGQVDPLDSGLTFGLVALILTFWVVISVLHRRANRRLADQVKTRLALRSAQDQYQGLVESAHDLVWQVDNEGRWTYLNRAARKIYGADPEALLGQVALDHADPAHLENDVRAFGEIHHGSDLRNHETVHTTVEGERRHLSFSARPLRGPSGEVIGAQGTARDITHQVAAREALEEVARKNSLVRSLINGSEDLIYFKDGEGVYQGCNWRFADSLGRTEEEVAGKTDAELVDSTRAASYRKSDMEALTSWDPVRYEEWVVDHEGNRRLWETVKTVFRHVEGDHLGLLGVVRDVTERKEAEERMRVLAEQAERATRMKSAFLANMSHEIQTPMNGVLGMTEILLDTELSKEQRTSLQIIQSSGESLLGVLNDILDISKIEAGHMELEEVSFDLHEQILGAVALFSHSAVEKGSELVVDLKLEVPQGVVGDPTRLRQIFSNLVGNAVKFTPEGEILVSVTWEGGDLDHARVKFSVRDTGVGIPDEKLQSIFQEFTQADSSTTREYGGTGLGLTISRHLVSLMGGDLEVESVEGQGSEFFFTLDFPIDENFAPRAEPEAGVDLSGTRALIVDDLETNRRIFREFMEVAGATVHSTESARDALRLLKTVQDAEPFDFVILDLLMPGRDGFQLAEDIRLDPQLRDLPILILTSSNRPGDRRLAGRLRINGFLQKPVSRADLLRGIQDVLDDVGARRASPVASGPEGEMEGPSPAEDVTKDPLEGMEILVAEDNLVNQQVALGLLSRWGCKVTLVGNGIEALASLETSVPDLILMDVQMPEMDGLETTRRIREDSRFASVPILALTAHVLPEERQMCEKVGMNDYVPKPFKPGELKDRVLFWAREKQRPLESPPSQGDDRGPKEASDPVESPMTADPSEDPPVLLEEFRRSMREAGIESVVGPAIEAYLSETPGRMEALDDAVAAGDMVAVRREAHGMKSGSKNIRADRFGDLLEQLETAGSEGRADDVRAAFPILKSAFEEVMEFLKG
jgi:two-component system sensor histidine kinase/response regulator